MQKEQHNHRCNARVLTAGETYQLRNQMVIDAICELVNITHDTYVQNQYVIGCEYAERITNDVQVAEALQMNALYWAWFKNEWLLRDENFIRKAQQSNYSVAADGTLVHTPITYLPAWQLEHNVHYLLSELEPQGQKMHASYAQLIGRIIKHLNTYGHE